MNRRIRSKIGGFSLVEVVLALGVIAFAILAIFGILPIGLGTGRDAENETRAVQIAQTIIDAISSQASTQFDRIEIPAPGVAPLDLSQSTSTPMDPAVRLYANNDGTLSSDPTSAVYSVNLITNNAPPGFDSHYANLVTVNVAWPATAPTPAQTLRTFPRAVTKY